jgi:uncharacterized membrane protein HdeD (DUF308 family)
MNARKLSDRIALGALGALALIGALAAFAALGGKESGLDAALAIILGTLIYRVPALAARQRHAPNTGSIAVINVLLGWTVIGWVVALAMALRDPRPAG